jgi:outer membrane protein assembly factor BamB
MQKLRPTPLRLAGIVCAAVLAGCATEKPKELKPAELTDFSPKVEARILWRVDVGKSRGEPLQPAVLDNAVYAAAANGTLLRIAPESGAVVWRIDVGARISAGVGSDGLLVAVATPRGEVLAFGPDGKSLWKAQVPSDVTTPPLVGRGVVVVRSTDHRVTAFDAADGKRRWTFQRQQPPLTLRTSSDMRFAGDNVAAGFPGGRLIGIAMSNGAARWEATVSEPKGATEVERLADVVGPVVVGAGDVCAAAFQGRLMCADATNGNLRWAREMPASAGVALDSQTVYSVDANSHVQAFARAGGASVWTNNTLHRRELTAPAVLPRAIAVGDFKGYLHLLAPADGALVGRVRIDSSRIVATPQVGAGLLIVQTQDGSVAALALDGAR